MGYLTTDSFAGLGALTAEQQKHIKGMSSPLAKKQWTDKYEADNAAVAQATIPVAPPAYVTTDNLPLLTTTPSPAPTYTLPYTPSTGILGIPTPLVIGIGVGVLVMAIYFLKGSKKV